MPQIPRYRRSVGPQESPDLRIDPSLGLSEGALRSSSEVFQSGGRLADLAQKINLNEIEKAEELGMVADDLELSRLEDRILNDPQTGALNRRGRDAFDTSKRVQEDWSKGVSSLGKGSMSARRRAAFLKNVSYRQVALNKRVNVFVSGEIQRYDDETTSSYRENLTREAIESWMDPGGVVDKVEKIENSLTAYAIRNGKSSQWLELNKANSQSNIHLGVLDKMVEADSFVEAQEYYKVFKEQILPQHRSRAAKVIEAGRIKIMSSEIVEDALSDVQEIVPKKGDSPFKISSIVESINSAFTGPEIRTIKGADSLGELIARIRKDPRVKGDEALLRATESRAKDRWNQIKVQRKENYDSDYRSAQKIVEQSGSMDAIPRRLLESLFSEDIRKLEVRASQKAANKKPKTQLDQLTHFYNALTLPDSDPNAVSNWSEADVWRLVSVIEEDTFKNKILPKWSESVEAKNSPAKSSAYHGTIGRERMILEGVVASGVGGIKLTDKMTNIEKNEDKRVAYWDFRHELEDMSAKHFQDHGKDPDNKTLREFISKIAIDKARQFEKVGTKNSIFFGLIGGEILMKDVTNEDAENEVFDIPTSDRMRFYNMWIGALAYGGGTPPSFEAFVSKRANVVQMQKAWIAWKRGRDEAEQTALLLGIKK